MARILEPNSNSIGALTEGIIIASAGGNIDSDRHYSTITRNGNLPEPAIYVNTVGEYIVPDALGGDVRLLACAVPSGTVGPTTTGEMYSGFIGTTEGPVFTDVDPNNSVIYRTQDTIGNEIGAAAALSGNALYDVYYAHVVTTSIHGGDPVAVYFEGINSIENVRTYPTYPHIGDPAANDLDVVITDLGIEVGLNNPIQLFTLNFEDEPYLMSDPHYYGPGRSDFASSGFVKVACHGIASDLWFHHTFAQTGVGAPAAAAQYDYLMPTSGALEWRVPKFVNYSDSTSPQGDYEGYEFYIYYIDADANESPPVILKYDQAVLTQFHEENDIVSLEDKLPTEAELAGPIPIVVKDGTYRKRLAIGIQDIDLQSIKYKDSGAYISNVYSSDSPIYAVSLEATEQLPDELSKTPWNNIQYYVQFGTTDTNEWHPISPRGRVGEIGTDGKNVPAVIILDTLMVSNEIESLKEQNNTTFVEFEKPVYNFRIKVEMNNAGLAGEWSPFVYDYKVMVMNRDVLSSSSIERYLFV